MDQYQINVAKFMDEYQIPLNSEGYGFYKGRQVRYLGHFGVFQVGQEDFDRWANSEDFEFDVKSKSGQRALRKWINTP